MGPYKCPDCGVWWAGAEHRCDYSRVTTSTDANGTSWHPENPALVDFERFLEG